MYGLLAWFAYLLSALGAINWGLVAFFKTDLVVSVTRVIRVKNLDKILYGLVALCGVYALLSLFTHGSISMVMGPMY